MAAQARSAWLKLLLDEMYDPAIAVQFRDKYGHDVVAVNERPELKGRDDGAIFEYACSAERAMVTENVLDFIELDRVAKASGERHFGMVFTSNKRYPRSRSATTGKLVRALDELLKPHGASHASLDTWIWL